MMLATSKTEIDRPESEPQDRNSHIRSRGAVAAAEKAGLSQAIKLEDTYHPIEVGASASKTQLIGESELKPLPTNQRTLPAPDGTKDGEMRKTSTRERCSNGTLTASESEDSSLDRRITL
jgi:hypothetical protein